MCASTSLWHAGPGSALRYQKLILCLSGPSVPDDGGAGLKRVSSEVTRECGGKAPARARRRGSATEGPLEGRDEGQIRQGGHGKRSPKHEMGDLDGPPLRNPSFPQRGCLVSGDATHQHCPQAYTHHWWCRLLQAGSTTSLTLTQGRGATGDAALVAGSGSGSRSLTVPAVVPGTRHASMACGCMHWLQLRHLTCASTNANIQPSPPLAHPHPPPTAQHAPPDIVGCRPSSHGAAAAAIHRMGHTQESPPPALATRAASTRQARP